MNTNQPAAQAAPETNTSPAAPAGQPAASAAQDSPGAIPGAPASAPPGAAPSSSSAAPDPAAAPAAPPPGPGAAASLLSEPEQPPARGAPADPDQAPITDWGKVDLQLGDALVDGAIMESFGQAAVASGLTPAQARAIAQGHVKAMKDAADAKLAGERQALNNAWGKEANARLDQVKTFCSRVERLPGCENFRAALVASGAASSAAVVKGLYAIARQFAEDSRGRFASGGLSGKETALEGIRSAFGLDG